MFFLLYIMSSFVLEMWLESWTPTMFVTGFSIAAFVEILGYLLAQWGYWGKIK